MQRSALIAVIGCVGLCGCGGSARSDSVASTRSLAATTSVGRTTSPPTAVPTTVTAPAPEPARRIVDPCPSRFSLPLTQTHRIPSAHTPCFRAVVRALWRAARTGSSQGALYAFFPLKAYERVKAIGDPRADYEDRLLADYRLDLSAAHALLGSAARSARLVRVVVPQGNIHWVPPGVCDNRLGYYEVPNSRLVYRVGGQLRSFGIASLIAWRGTWYVVHLGAVTRSGGGGVVDDPSDGPGEPAPSLTC
jgi:hypothetical protein